MSAVAKSNFPGTRENEVEPAITSAFRALDQQLMRARWAHGWKVPPQAFEPYSLAYLLGFLERHCEEFFPLSDSGVRLAQIGLLNKLLGPESVERLDETLKLVAQHEITLNQAWQTGRKEADAQIGPEKALACSWREYMYLEIEHYSFSYPRD